MICATLILSEFALQQTPQTMLDLKHVYLLMDIGVMNSLESYSNFDPPPKNVIILPFILMCLIYFLCSESSDTEFDKA